MSRATADLAPFIVMTPGSLIKTSLEAESYSILAMKEIAAKLEWRYSVRSVLEGSTTVVTGEVVKREFPARVHDSDNPMVFSTIVVTFRVGKKDGRVRLIRASEWVQQLCKS